ncbi:MAG: peptidoglycan-binding domain-containing protein [Arenicellales bacterium]|nr:peptidoglycan-binding domain-containing protein [Arenicellales bacterium]
MSGVGIRRIGFTIAAVTAWLNPSIAWGDSQNEVFKRLTDAVKEYSATAKEQQKIDQFHIQFALRRAVTAERPGIPYRWNNLHTNHKGEIVLLDFIGPRGNGRVCVDFKHTYYLGGASPIEDEGTICQDSEGVWDDMIVRAVYEGKGATNQVAAAPRYSTQVVRDVQTLLVRLNYDPGPVDGLFGQRTRRAIEYYQRDEGLSITGELSEKLVASLNRSVAVLDGLPSTAETIAVGDESTETPSSTRPGSPGGLTVEEDLGPTTPPDMENNLDSASKATVPPDRAPQPTGLGSSLTGGNSPREPGKEDFKAASVDPNLGVMNTKDSSSAASNPEDTEVAANNEQSLLLTIEDVDSLTAQAPTTTETKDQTALHESTDTPSAHAAQVNEGQDAVDQAQSSERASIQNKDKTPASKDVEESNSVGIAVASYDSNWFMVLIGLVFCGVAGLIAARYLSSAGDRSTLRQAETDRMEAELDNKIAIVVGQADKGLDKVPKLDRDAAAGIHRPSSEGVRMPSGSKEAVEIERQNEQSVPVAGAQELSSRPADIQRTDISASAVGKVPPTQVSPEVLSVAEDPLQHHVDENSTQDLVVESDRHFAKTKSHDEVTRETTPDETPYKEMSRGTMEGSEDMPGQQSNDEDSEADSPDTILQAVTEFDELIKETELVLAMDLEPDSRDHITKAIEQATKLIKKAFEKDPVEGNSHKYTKKAIRKATKLIEQALEEHLAVEISQLRVKNE